MLAWHVSYWDRLGWKDKYASPENNNRQKRRAEKGNAGAIGTPQFTVANTFVAGDQIEKQVLVDADRAPKFGIDADARIEHGKISATIKIRNVDAAPLGKDVNVIAVLYTKTAETDCKAGENAGKKLKEFFLALKTLPPQPASSFLEKAVPLTFDVPSGIETSNLGIAVLVEDSTSDTTLECRAVPVEKAK